MYKPVSLPPLARAACPYRVQTKRATGSIYSIECKAETLECGFCEQHKYCHDVMNLLGEIGFPSLQINNILHIGYDLTINGFVERACDAREWEEYIVRLPAPGVLYRFVVSEKNHVETPRFTQLFLAMDEYRKKYFPQNEEIAEAFNTFKVFYFSDETTVERLDENKSSHSV